MFYRSLSRLLTLGAITMFFACRPLLHKMAFHPDTNYSPDTLPASVEEIFILSLDHIYLQCYLLRGQSKQAILYCHGNAGNISHRLDDLKLLNQMGFTVLGLGYRGYGKSEGKPTEKGIYKDAQAAFNYLTDSLDFPSHQITIMGRSIGSAAASHVAQHKHPRSLILVSPLINAEEYAKAHGLGAIAFLAKNAFDNLTHIKNCQSPLLIIHGTQDEVIPYAHGQKIFESAPVPKKFIPLTDETHNTLSSNPKYWQALQAFLSSP